VLNYLHILLLLFHPTLFSVINDNSRARHKAISGRSSDYFGFKLRKKQ